MRPRPHSNPAFVLPLGFAGGLKDEHTGFVRFGHRDYDPEVGRFTDRDPLGDTGGDHDLYEYCVDDPVNKVDPTGLFLVNRSKTAGQIPEPAPQNVQPNGPEFFEKAWDYMKPPLWRDRDDPRRIAAENKLEGALNEWGRNMQAGAHPIAGIIQEAGKDNPNYFKGVMDGLFPFPNGKSV